MIRNIIFCITTKNFINSNGLNMISNISYENFKEIIINNKFKPYNIYTNSKILINNININYFDKNIFSDIQIYKNIEESLKKHYLQKKEKNNFNLKKDGNKVNENNEIIIMKDESMYDPKNKIKIYYPKFTKEINDDYEIYIKNEIHRKNKVELTYINKKINNLILDYKDFNILSFNTDYNVYELPIKYVKDLILLIDIISYSTFSEISFKKSFLKINPNNSSIYYIHIWFIINGIQYHFNIRSKDNFNLIEEKIKNSIDMISFIKNNKYKGINS